MSQSITHNNAGQYGKQEHAQIHDNIFIGSKNSVFDTEFLTANDIKCIINMSNADYLTPNNIATVRVKNIRDIMPTGKDFDTYTIAAEAKAKSVNVIMHEYISRGDNVLVHCEAGVNRSSFVICSYLIDYMDMSAADAMQRVKDINGSVRMMPALTNGAFVHLLNQRGM